jgi:hypothetical protein
MPLKNPLALVFLCPAIFALFPGTSDAGTPLVRVKGSEFDGEAIFGMAFFGMPNINYVYSQENRGIFHGPPYLFARFGTRGNPLFSPSRKRRRRTIEVSGRHHVDGKTVFKGKNEFSGTAWEWRNTPSLQKSSGRYQ